MIDASELKDSLTKQRWFGDKERVLASIEVLDEAILDDGPPTLVIALVEVTFEDGGSTIYNLPLLNDEDGVRDALEDADRLRIIGSLMGGGHSVKGNHGVFHFGGPGLDPMDPPGATSIRPIGHEQSNSSLVLDEKVILKLFRKVEPGPNPDLELARILTSEGFEYVPSQVGEVLYEGELEGLDPENAEVSIDLGIAAQYVADANEGWAQVLLDVHRFYDEVHPDDTAEDMRALTAERAHKTFESLERLGEVTAMLHITLSREELEPDFIKEPITHHDLVEWAEAARGALKTSLRSGVYGVGRFESDFEERIDRFLALEEDLGFKLRVHGDYHLGQVLIDSKGWLIIDFEGEPRRTIGERRAKQSPLRDVAGMLRSFSYAATAALFERAEPDSTVWAQLDPWGSVWEELAREHFLAGYLRSAHEGQFLPADRNATTTMLDVFEIDKALYELGYELGHRPDWVRIPLRGLHQVIERSEKR